MGTVHFYRFYLLVRVYSIFSKSVISCYVTILLIILILDLVHIVNDLSSSNIYLCVKLLLFNTGITKLRTARILLIKRSIFAGFPSLVFGRRSITADISGISCSILFLNFSVVYFSFLASSKVADSFFNASLVC